MGIFDKGVQKTRRSFFERISRAVVGKSKVDDDVLQRGLGGLHEPDAGRAAHAQAQRDQRRVLQLPAGRPAALSSFRIGRCQR